MKLIIAGSRTINPSSTFLEACISEAHLRPTEIISGGAPGVDASAKALTEQRFTMTYYSLALKDKYTEFPANWNKHGKAAGPIRNIAMAEYGDALLLIWDGESRGSKNMKETMLELGKPVYEVILRSYNVPEET